MMLHRQIGGGHLARDRDALALQLFKLHRTGGDHHRAVAVADAGSAGHQDVLVRDVRIRVIGNRGQLVHALHGFSVQRLDVFQDVLDVYEPRADFLRREAIEHEGVVRVRTMGANDVLH